MEMRMLHSARTPAVSLAEAVLLPALEPVSRAGGAPVDNLRSNRRGLLAHVMHGKSAPAARQRRSAQRAKSWVTYG